MKTTLKRGIGRAAELNGNGRSVYPPEIAPAMRRYRQPPPTRSRVAVVGKIFLWVILVALMLSSGVAAGTYLYVERDIAEGLGARSRDVREAQERLDAAIPGEPTIALVVGYDKRVGREAAVTGNSDTLMLVRIDPEVNAVSMLSFPRDLIVDVHCPNLPPVRDRINSAYPRCGAQGSLLTVQELTGLPINYLITVNFRGFKQIVAHLGGVWVDVDRRYFNDNSQGFERFATIDLKPGYQKLNGQKALDFVRYRHTDSDLYRVARQQAFVKAVKARLHDFSALDLPRVVNVVTKNVEVGHIGKFNARTILGYALLLYDLPAGHVFQMKIDLDCYQGFAELTVSEVCVDQALQDFIQPDVEAAEKATAVALRRRARTRTPAPAATTVMVLNGNGRPGAAANASSQLAQKGYKLAYAPSGDANAPSFQYFHTEVYYDGSVGSFGAARRLATLFGNARVEPLPSEIEPLSNGAMLTVILGQTYHGSIAPTPADRTPERRAPQVSRDTSTFAVLKDVASRLPFQLYAPTVIARGSYLDRAMPLRMYRVGEGRATRLTFTNGLEYWGIQQTDWEDAPALSDPNEVTTIKGRRYRLYYSGVNLHMVVLEAGDSTVWVVNTLLDRLSNETMLEIAKSLRPLRRR